MEPQNPLILKSHRLMEAFAKSDDERDFYIDRLEGFLVYVDLDKSQAELDALEEELRDQAERYCQIPKLSFYETKKIMEGFVNEKVYDIDTKEKLLDIIQSKEARENFLEFIYDHHSEQEKWQQYYQERSRIRIIEWLRANHFHFVFEEDLELPRAMLEKLKQSLFQAKVGKDVLTARKMLSAKAKTYYSNEALNPRPKRGRPPKQAIKQDIEPQVTIDIYTTVSPAIRPFLFTPEVSSSLGFSVFSSKFSDQDLLQKRLSFGVESGSLSQKLASIRSLSNRWLEGEQPPAEKTPYDIEPGFDDFDDEDDEDEDDLDDDFPKRSVKSKKSAAARSKNKPKNGVKTKAKAKAKEPASLKTKKLKVNPSETKSNGKKRIMPKVVAEKSKKSKSR